MLPLLNIFLAVTLWVQVPQWNDDWSNCAVDVPDTSCHWYIVQADNTFGEGFDWETAPWYSIEGLQDVADLHDQTLESGHLYTCLLYTSPSPRDLSTSRMPSSA